MSAPFQFPKHLSVGDRVEYSTDGITGNRCLAMIVEVKDKTANSVDLLLLPTMAFRRDCWHIDDPRVETDVHIFSQQRDRGVFRLVGDQQYRADMLARLASLERTCHGMVIENGQMKTAMLKVQQSIGVETDGPAQRTRKTHRKEAPAGV